MYGVRKFARKDIRGYIVDILFVGVVSGAVDSEDVICRKNEVVKAGDFIAWSPESPRSKFRISQSYIANFYREVI